MQSLATTPEEYLAELPEDRRAILLAVREVILKNLPEGVNECVAYGNLSYSVSYEVYPHGYHCGAPQPLPFIGLAAQKNYMSLYLFCLYMDPAWVQKFAEDYEKTGKKFDMGKSCVRFKALDDLPLDLIGRTIAEMSLDKFIAAYESNLPEAVKRKRAKGL